MMQVFLSWSGERSRVVAEALSKWLSQVIQAVEPWISVDIEKGVRWAPEVAERLEKSRVGIICLTPENLESRWILFEAGALSKTKDAYVCTFLLALTPAEVEPPLGQFQHTSFEKQDVARLVRTVNASVARDGEKSLSESVLTDVFETFWPQLEAKLNTVLAQQPEAARPKRSESEILDEILTTVRSMERRQVETEHASKARELAQLYRWVKESPANRLFVNESATPRDLKELVDFYIHTSGPVDKSEQAEPDPKRGDDSK